METFNTIEKRRSIRNFTGDPIPLTDLERIVNAGRLAPSGNNQQPWDFIVVTDESIRQHLSKAASWSANASAIIVVVLDTSSKYWVEDGSAAIENILLAATDLGYGSCWLQGNAKPHEAEFKLLLNIPAYLSILSLVPIGVPVEWPETKEKKPLEDVLHWETY